MRKEKKLEFMIFDKTGFSIINSGTCANVNTFDNYKVVKKFTKNNKDFTIVERYFDNKLFSKDYSSYNKDTDKVECYFWYALDERDLGRYRKAEIL